MSGVDSFKKVVVNHMELRADVTRGQIADETNRAGMERGDTQILGATRSRLPFWNLPTILEGWIKNVSRTPPRMRVHERAVGSFGAGPNLFRG